MRSHPAEYEIEAPDNLSAVLALMHREPGEWMPIAGGTEVMVLFGAGKLANRKLVSLWKLPELTTTYETSTELTIGSGCTYTQLRNHASVLRDFPLLAQTASWSGSIANQNRGTIGGNIVNASPAADSPPALLAYDAEVELVSARGSRRMSYSKFHLGYKKTALQPDELLLAIHLPRLSAPYFSYARKVGPRIAQAISKVCIAALGRLQDSVVRDIRLAMGSVAPVPLRLSSIEQMLIGRPLDKEAIASAGRALIPLLAPIDDIRSTAEYRRQVAVNLLAEFLHGLAEWRGNQ